MSDRAKNVAFVRIVERHPCLYNFNLSDYINRDRTEKAWADVARKTNLSILDSKRKWKNLRSVFVRQSRLALRGNRRYYLNKHMSFVAPFIKTGYKQHFHQTTSDVNTQEDEQVNHMEEDDFNEERESDVANASDDASGGALSEQQTKTFSTLDKCNTSDVVDQQILEYFENSDRAIESGQTSPTVCNKMFLLSLLPDLGMMTHHQIRRFKRSTLATIDEILDENPLQACSNSSENQYVPVRSQDHSLHKHSSSSNCRKKANISIHKRSPRSTNSESPDP